MPFSDATKLLYSCMRHGILFTDKCTQKTENYGAQNEVYNDDWAENGLIVLCFS